MFAEIFQKKHRKLTIKVVENKTINDDKPLYGFIAYDGENNYFEFDYSTIDDFFKKFPTKKALINHVVKVFLFEDFNFFDSYGNIELPKNKSIEVIGY